MKKIIFVLLILLVSLIGTKAYYYKYQYDDGKYYYLFSNETDTPFFIDSFPNMSFWRISKEDGTASVNQCNGYYRYNNSFDGELRIPETVCYEGKTYRIVQIGEAAFYYGEKICSAIIPKSVKVIGQKAFWYTNLEKIKLPENIELIMDNAFTETPIKELYIPSGKMAGSAISGCKKLEVLILGEDFKGFYNIGGGPYNPHNPQLTNIYCLSRIPPETGGLLYGPDAYMGLKKVRRIIHVPLGCKEAYANAEGWKEIGEDHIVDDINLEGIHHAQLKTQDSDAPVYDLQGRRVENPKQGEIYIQNGKKYINK